MEQLSIEEWMSKDVSTIDREKSVFDAVKKMVDRKIGAVVIVDAENRPEGMVSERDVLNRVVALGFNARDVKSKDIMVSDVITIKKSDDYITANKLIKYINIRHLPVVDDDGKLVGIISIRDLIKVIT